MKQILFAGQAFLVGDEAATALLQYAVALADLGRAGTVDLSVVRGDNNSSTRAYFLLASGSPLAVTAIDSQLNEPDNDVAVQQIWRRTESLRMPRHIEGDSVENYVEFGSEAT